MEFEVEQRQIRKKVGLQEVGNEEAEEDGVEVLREVGEVQ